MSETEWLACTEPNEMMRILYGKLTDRKRRLYACACCFRIWDSLPDVRSRHAVDVALRHADGLASDEELEAAANQAEAVWIEELERIPLPERETEEAFFPLAYSAAAYNAAVPLHCWGGAPAYEPPFWIVLERASDRRTEGRALCDLLRDIVGNPFHSIAVEPAWLTSDVVAMCRGMYQSRDFAAMPILADALQDAGCENAGVLEHCRGDGPHARGCWVVDLLLGKG